MRYVTRGVVVGAIVLVVFGASVRLLTESMGSGAITVTKFFNKGDPIKIATRANFFGTITNTASATRSAITRRSPRR